MGLSKIKVKLNIFLNFGTEINKQWEDHKYCDWVGLNTRVGFYWRKIQGLVVQSFSSFLLSDLLCSWLVLGVGFLCSRLVLGSRVGLREHRMKRSPNSHAHFGKVVHLKLRSVELTGSSLLLPVVGPVEGVEGRCIPPPGFHRSGVMLAAAIWGEGADI